MSRMNNNGWRQARREAGLPLVRVHDLRHNSESRIIPSAASNDVALSEVIVLGRRQAILGIIRGPSGIP